MNRRDALKAFAGLALCPLCQPAFAAEGAHWSYEGATGPAKWGDVDAASKVCTIGLQQSPIDIVAPIKSQLPPIKLNWAKGADTIVNNGHTIQLNFAEGSTLTLGDKKYKLLQVHFHRPSEHMVAGKSFPMEAHFVHRADSGGLAVVGVLMSTGKPNAAFAKVVSTMPAKEGPPVKADAGFNAERDAAEEADLLPLFRLADDAALQRDGGVAAADDADHGGGDGRGGVRKTLSAERAAGAAG